MFTVFIITLREGVEIAVVLAIILAYLRQLGQMKETGKVWLGTGAATLVSVLVAVANDSTLILSQANQFNKKLGLFLLLPS